MSSYFIRDVNLTIPTNRTDDFITIVSVWIHHFVKFSCFIRNIFLQAEGIAKKVREDISIVTPVAIIIYFFSHKFMCVFFLLVRSKRILPMITKNRRNIWI